MIEEGKNVGTHADQMRASSIDSLRRAGIGRTYADRSLGSILPEGQELAEWFLANFNRVRQEGLGVDIRGVGVKSVDLTNLTGRAFLKAGMTTLLIPLVRLPRMLADDEDRVILQNTHCLILRDFETPHANPLRPYEIAEVEAFLIERVTDARSTSVCRHGLTPSGWWSETLERMLEEVLHPVEIAR